MLELKDLRDQVDFRTIDVTVPRPKWLQEKLHGTTALPALETPEGKILKESLILLRYLDESLPDRPVAQLTPYERAVENMLIAEEGPFGTAGYRFILNQDPNRRDALRTDMLERYRRLDDYLCEHAPDRTWLFEDFGLAETVFTPLFMRFGFLSYYEGFELPDEPSYERVRRWREACLDHPAAQQVTYEQVVKLYYDYAKGAANGALLEGRKRSSFVFDPDWRKRPMPPRDKYGHSATDAELGLNG